MAVLALFVTSYRHFTIQYCAVCASERRTDEWGFGLGADSRLPLASSDGVRESVAFRELCDADHRHEWRTDHTKDAGLGGGFVACGGWREGAFAGEYERRPELRAIVRREIETGAIDRATALRLVAVPRNPWSVECPAPGTLPDAALLSTAERILGEHFAPLGHEAPAEVAAHLRWMGAWKFAR